MLEAVLHRAIEEVLAQPNKNASKQHLVSAKVFAMHQITGGDLEERVTVGCSKAHTSLVQHVSLNAAPLVKFPTFSAYLGWTEVVVFLWFVGSAISTFGRLLVPVGWAIKLGAGRSKEYP